MSDKIINTDTMIGKVIAVMVALLFVVILAFPVANSLSNQGSDGGESAPITYTNTGDFYYKSATADSSEHTLKVQTSPGSTESILIITVLSDNESVYETEFTMPGDDGIVPASDSVLLAVCKDTEYNTNMYLALSNMYGVGWFLEEGGHGEFYPGLNPETDESGTPYWVFTIQNGKITQTSEGDSMTYDCSCYLSSVGEYVLANAPVKVAPNNEILAFGTTIVPDPEHSTEWVCATYSPFDALMLENGNNTISLASQHEFVNETTADLSCTITDVITVNSMSVDVSMSLESRDGTYHLTATSDNLSLLVPVTVTVGSNESVEYVNDGLRYANDNSGTHTIHIARGEDNSSIVTVDGAVSHPALFGGAEGGAVTPNYLIAIAKDGAYLEMTPDGRLDWIMIDNSYWNVTPTSVEGSNYTYDLTISNGVMSWSGTLNASDEEVEHNTEIMYYVSNAGEYVYTTIIGQNSGDTSVPQFKMADKGMSAYIYTMEMVDVGNSWIWRPVLIFGQFDSSSLSNGNSSVDLTWDTDYTVSSPTCIVQSSEKAGIRIITSVEVNADLQYGNATQDYSPRALGVFVPATITVSGDEGGDSDSSGLGGIASTLVKLVPILLIIGIILVLIVPMIQNRMQ